MNGAAVAALLLASSVPPSPKGDTNLTGTQMGGYEGQKSAQVERFPELIKRGFAYFGDTLEGIFPRLPQNVQLEALSKFGNFALYLQSLEERYGIESQDPATQSVEAEDNITTTPDAPQTPVQN